jgi:hypothetical protein
MEENYVEVPGLEVYELPPLLVRQAIEVEVNFAFLLDEAGEMLSDGDSVQDETESRKQDLAGILVQGYKGLIAQWLFGDSVLEWARQCEITFGCKDALRGLLCQDVWPHPSRARFVELAGKRGLRVAGSDPQNAVGLRLAFRQPPPADCFSDHFLFYLNSTVTGSAYKGWIGTLPSGLGFLPPDRFHFEVVSMRRD